MLPRDETSFLKSTILGVTGLPDGSRVGGDTSDSGTEVVGDVGANFED